MSYDVVVCTRNRPAALSLSLPRMLRQDPAPTRLVVVDSSDDPAPTAQAVQEAAAATRHGTDVKVLRAAKGLTRQRNAGLREVREPVVFFPDDDSIWFDGYAAAKLAVYERDPDGSVGAVSGRESTRPPGAFEGAARYQMDRSHLVRQRIALRRTRIEKRAFPDPFVINGQALQARHQRPAWFEDLDVHVVEWMTGFRMSFRTDAIRAAGFDEALADYGLFEDVDASFAVARDQLVVAAHDAHVHHYQSPGPRGHGRVLGATQILNRAYVVLKRPAATGDARDRLRRHAMYKCAQYAVAPATPWARERLAGAIAATQRIPRLMAVPPEQLSATYHELLSEVLRP